MDKQKYVIVEIDPEDAWCERNHDFLVGQIVTSNTFHNSFFIKGYCGGWFLFDVPQYLYTSDESDEKELCDGCYFSSIQIQTLENNTKETGDVVYVMDDDEQK